jgi:hypothetical protein
MYQGFNLNISFDDLNRLKEYNLPRLQLKGLPTSTDISKKWQETIRKIITEKSFENEIIDGTKIKNDWFPEINADVFISHSHADQQLAITFADWLKQNFNIDAFIDSTVWGYADELLKIIDNKYCKMPKPMTTYDYNKRNYSTAHVHAMLSNALIQMIDKTECLFFLNTPNSLSESNTIVNKTQSPWLYTELAASKFIQKKKPDRIKTASTQIPIQYNVDLSHLTTLTRSSLDNWKTNYENKYHDILASLGKRLFSNTRGRIFIESLLGKQFFTINALNELYKLNPVNSDKT